MTSNNFVVGDEKPKEPRILVCASAETRRISIGSTFDRCCGECQTRVVVAVSGQTYLKEHPETTIICSRCYFERHAKQPHSVALTSDIETLLNEFSSEIPNPYRGRN